MIRLVTVTRPCYFILSLLSSALLITPQDAKHEGTFKGLLAISSVRADQKILDCDADGHTTITVQAFFVDPKPKTPNARILLEIYLLSTAPAGNSVAFYEKRQEAKLVESPAIATFEVGCSADSVEGAVNIAGRIGEAPTNFDIAATDPPEDGFVHLRIKRSQGKAR